MMSSLIRISILLCSIGSLLADYDLTHDMTYEYLKKYINHSVDPCENFYDHVCPFGLELDEIPVFGFISKALRKKFEKQIKTSALERAFFEKINTAGTDEEGWRAEISWTTLKGLRVHPLLYKHLESLNINIDEKMEALSAEFRTFSNIVIDQLMRTKLNTLHNSTIQQLVEFEMTQVVKISEETIPVDDMIYNYQTLMAHYDRLIRKYNETPEAAMNIMEGLLVAVYNSNPDLYELIGWYDIPDSAWSPNTNIVEIYNAFTLTTINMTRPTLWGLVMPCVGHELSHPIVETADGLESSDPDVARNRKCILDYLEKAFEEFGPDENGGKPLSYKLGDTHGESIPDLEGLQAAYLGYKNEFAGRGDQRTYADLEITNDQLFFYAFGSSWCDNDEGRKKDRGGHAPDFLRVNAILPLLDSFQETFKCKPGQRMFKIRDHLPADRCNFYGQVARKLSEE